MSVRRALTFTTDAALLALSGTASADKLIGAQWPVVDILVPFAFNETIGWPTGATALPGLTQRRRR